MKLHDATIEALSNFASINPSLLFKEGNVLKTVSPQKTIIGRIEVPDEFKQEFAIYDLKQFLAIVNLFENPELEFEDSYLTISDGEEKVVYFYGNKDLFAHPEKDINFPGAEVEFTLTPEAFAKIQKAGGTLGLPEVAVVGENGSITVRALNTKETEGNTYQFKVGETDQEFRAVFKTENLKLLEDEYNVQINSKGIAKFESEKARYFVAIEAASSKF